MRAQVALDLAHGGRREQKGRARRNVKPSTGAQVRHVARRQNRSHVRMRQHPWWALAAVPTAARAHLTGECLRERVAARHTRLFECGRKPLECLARAISGRQLLPYHPRRVELAEQPQAVQPVVPARCRRLEQAHVARAHDTLGDRAHVCREG